MKLIGILKTEIAVANRTITSYIQGKGVAPKFFDLPYVERCAVTGVSFRTLGSTTDFKLTFHIKEGYDLERVAEELTIEIYLRSDYIGV